MTMADEDMAAAVDENGSDCSPTLEDRLDALIEAQVAMTSAIGDLAQSVAMLAQSLVDEQDAPENPGGTLDD